MEYHGLYHRTITLSQSSFCCSGTVLASYCLPLRLSNKQVIHFVVWLTLLCVSCSSLLYVIVPLSLCMDVNFSWSKPMGDDFKWEPWLPIQWCCKNVKMNFISHKYQFDWFKIWSRMFARASRMRFSYIKENRIGQLTMSRKQIKISCHAGRSGTMLPVFPYVMTSQCITLSNESYALLHTITW